MTDLRYLHPGLTQEERLELLMRKITDLGWRVDSWPRWLLKLGWSKRRSMAFGLTKTLYMADHTRANNRTLIPVLSHEARHAERAKEHGRTWTLTYILGPVLVVAAALALIPAVVLLFWQFYWTLVPFAVLLLSAVVLWGPSERHRLREEIEGESFETAARLVCYGFDAVLRYPLPEKLGERMITADLLHSYRWPYLVGGEKADVYRKISEGAYEVLRAAQADSVGSGAST